MNLATPAADASAVPARTPRTFTRARSPKTTARVSARGTGWCSAGTMVASESTSAAPTAPQATIVASQVSSPARYPGNCPKARST